MRIAKWAVLFTCKRYFKIIMTTGYSNDGELISCNLKSVRNR